MFGLPPSPCERVSTNQPAELCGIGHAMEKRAPTEADASTNEASLPRLAKFLPATAVAP